MPSTGNQPENVDRAFIGITRETSGMSGGVSPGSSHIIVGESEGGRIKTTIMNLEGPPDYDDYYLPHIFPRF